MISKQFTLSILLCIFISVGSAQAQPQPKTIPMGLFNNLVQIKYTAELYLSKQLKKDSALAIYNTLRYQTDGLVYQLSADMIANNSARKIRLLNKWCLQHSFNLQNSFNKPLHAADAGNTNLKGVPNCITNYVQQLNVINQLFNNYISESNYGEPYENAKTINLSTNVFYLLKDSYTILEGLANIKTQKTMAIIELLDHTRLLSPGELAKLAK